MGLRLGSWDLGLFSMGLRLAPGTRVHCCDIEPFCLQNRTSAWLLGIGSLATELGMLHLNQVFLWLRNRFFRTRSLSLALALELVP